VLRFEDVPFVDATGMHAIEKIIDGFQRQGTRVILCKLRPNVLARLDRAGILARVGRDNVIEELGEYCAYAPRGGTGPDAPGTP